MNQKEKPRVKYLSELGIYKLFGIIPGRRLPLEYEAWNFYSKTEALTALTALKLNQ